MFWGVSGSALFALIICFVVCTGSTQEERKSSRDDLNIVDWDIKHYHSVISVWSTKFGSDTAFYHRTSRLGMI